MPVTITRTYERFAVRWADGSRWSGYSSAAEAQEVIGHGSREGEVERTTFDVSFDEAHAGLYNPGIAEIRAGAGGDEKGGAMREVPAPTRGSGPVECCGGHRKRCLFGRPHTWTTWYENARLQRTGDTVHCYDCGGVCTADEDGSPEFSLYGDPDGCDRNGAYDGFQVTSDAGPGL